MSWHEILLALGGIPNTEPNALWGGFLSCLTEFTIIGALYGMYRKHKCDERKCWRLSKHPVAGTPYKACRKHHPTVPDRPVKGEMAAAHARAQRIAEAAVRTAPAPEPAATSRRKR